MKTIYLVAGARPNFMKIAPIVRAIKAHGGLEYKIILPVSTMITI